MSRKYVLVGKRVVEWKGDFLEWARRVWADESEAADSRRVAFTDVSNKIHVSTVFLGLDHNWLGRGEPLVFETMIFGGPNDGYQDRCSTWEQAEAMHAEAVSIAKAKARRT